jgi:hypothetical protein
VLVATIRSVVSFVIYVFVSALCIDSLKGMMLVGSAHLAEQDESMLSVFAQATLGSYGS